MSEVEDRVSRAGKPAEESMRLHPVYRGKVQVMPKCPIRSFEDFALWYTPGVAAPCRDIAAHPEMVYEHTNKGNMVAVVSDGSRVLGLGNIGPEAGLPVMEGKALLFKYLGGVDAVPICLDAHEPQALIAAVEQLQPSFGGINLEDISSPKCFQVLDTLRERCRIPIWHDDQQGTGTVALAALFNALRIVGKEIGDVRIAMIGMGAANVATYRLFKAAGVDPAGITACDSRGTLHAGRGDLERALPEEQAKWQVCIETNPVRIEGGVEEALSGADVCVAFSSPGPMQIRPEWIGTMARDAVVIAGANPVPEIWPWVAKEAGARIVATGRSDFPNQVNNSLGFPGIFRGVLDVRARTITDSMAIAAATALADHAVERGLSEESLLPRMDDQEAFVREAVATGLAAQQEGVAQLERTAEQLEALAASTITRSREATGLLQREGVIPAVPKGRI
ncbi:MAG: NADP-dependent malic enzyme [Myxococcales bacterium]|nr:NADP-dependent malic enzyme [Myxococcales bacterium]